MKEKSRIRLITHASTNVAHISSSCDQKVFHTSHICTHSLILVRRVSWRAHTQFSLGSLEKKQTIMKMFYLEHIPIKSTNPCALWHNDFAVHRDAEL